MPLQSLDPIYVDFSVPQQEVGKLRAGTAVRGDGRRGARSTAAGRVTAVDSVVDEATRNVQVQATFANPDGRSAPGHVRRGARRRSAPAAPVIALPASAINYAPYGDSVFVVDDLKSPSGKTYRGVRQQFVKLGAGRGDQVAVLSGVKPGEEVVTSGVFKLRNGAAVVVNNEVQPANDPTPEPEDS